MSKDPAFLFYSSDFLTGTALMTDEQIGKYIKLLCYQHQMGHLSERDMLKICSTYDEDIFSKFEKDQDGLFFNARLHQEVEKRKAYSESRRQNRTKKDMNNICNSYVPHMENENINVISIKKLEKEKKQKTHIQFDHLSISIDDHQKLIAAGYTENQVNEIYQDIENYKGNKKYKSLYLTALKWLANNKAKQPEPTKITYLND